MTNTCKQHVLVIYCSSKLSFHLLNLTAVMALPRKVLQEDTETQKGQVTCPYHTLNSGAEIRHELVGFQS